MHHPTDRIANTTAFVTPVVEHWLEREIAQWVHPMNDRSDDPSHHERTLLPQSYISLPTKTGLTEWSGQGYREVSSVKFMHEPPKEAVNFSQIFLNIFDWFLNNYWSLPLMCSIISLENVGTKWSLNLPN